MRHRDSFTDLVLLQTVNFSLSAYPCIWLLMVDIAVTCSEMMAVMIIDKFSKK